MNRFFNRLPIIGNKVPGKLVLSFLMLFFALVLALVFKSADRLTCLAAMFFSFLGDIALNHNSDHSKQTKRDFLLGGIAFIFAHLLYCFAYYQKMMLKGYSFINPGSISVVFALVLISACLIYFKSKIGDFSKLFWFGVSYLWLTGINYTTIFSYAYSARSIESIAMLGGALFLASDLIIGLEKFFGLKSRLARELVWWLYPIGQIIIIAIA